MCSTCGKFRRARLSADCKRCGKLRREIVKAKVKLGKVQRRLDKKSGKGLAC